MLGTLVREYGVSPGEMRANGEFFLHTRDGLLIFYNYADSSRTYGDGQSLDIFANQQADVVERWVLSYLSPGMVYLDVGANNGYYYILKAARQVPDLAVFAFEPDPMILHHLRRNIEENQAVNVEVIPKALGDSAGSKHLAAGLGASGYLVNPGAEGIDVLEVDCTTLDSFIAEKGLGRLDLIKVDIEGGEAAFLRGGAATLRRFRPALLLELDDSHLRRAGSSQEEVVSLLHGMGYSCRRVLGTRDALAVTPDREYGAMLCPEGWLGEVMA